MTKTNEDIKENSILTNLKIELFNRMFETWNQEDRRFDLYTIRDAFSTYHHMKSVMEKNSEEGEKHD